MIVFISAFIAIDVGRLIVSPATTYLNRYPVSINCLQQECVKPVAAGFKKSVAVRPKRNLSTLSVATKSFIPSRIRTFVLVVGANHASVGR